MKRNMICLALIVGVLMVAFPDLAFAIGGGGLESKVNNVTSGLITFLLPAAACLGLAYAGILAATGDESAKARMVSVAICSAVGMLAPFIIRWLQSLVN